jgi:hypothetical protein
VKKRRQYRDAVPGALWEFVDEWLTRLYHPSYWPTCNHWRINCMSYVRDYPTNGTIKTVISYVSPSCGLMTTRQQDRFGKTRGSGLCLFVNNGWCAKSNLSAITQQRLFILWNSEVVIFPLSSAQTAQTAQVLHKLLEIVSGKLICMFLSSPGSWPDCHQLQWVNAHLRWHLARWRSVLFTNESWFQLYWADCRQCA